MINAGISVAFNIALNIILVKYIAHVGLASLVMGLLSYLTYNELYGYLGISKLNNLISLLGAVFLGALLYGILCYVLRVEEIRDFITEIKIRF